MNAPHARFAALPWVALCAALLLALHAWLAVSATTQFCTTNDELAHVTGGYSYWKFNDYRFQPENGNLSQRWCALPLLTQNLRFPSLHGQDWKKSDVWSAGYDFFYREGNPVDYMLLCSRAMMVLWSVAAGLLVFLWSRKLWGDAGGLFSLTLYVLSPNFLANGPLAVSDVIMVFFLLAATGAWWRQARRLSWKSCALSGAVFGLACVAKFSAVLLLPIFVVLLLVRSFDRQPLIIVTGGSSHLLTAPRQKLLALAAATFLQGLLAVFIIWAFYDFRYAAANPLWPGQTDFWPTWASISAGRSPVQAVIDLCRHWHLLPEAFLFGFNHVMHFAQGRSAFLNGTYSNTGWWYFFPYAFLVKTPLPTLLAFLLAGGFIGWRWWPCSGTRCPDRRLVARDLHRVAPLVALFVIYWIFSLTSHLNIGLRHILPVYPPLFIAAGLLARPGAWRRWRLAMTGILALWLAAVSFAIRPTYLAYFNPLAGGPDHGYEHLVDSSLDWGQDLPALFAWLHAHRRPGEPVYLAYFGNGDPAYYGIDASRLAPVWAYGPWKHWSAFSPGLYCVSATMLENDYSESPGPWNLARERRYQQLLAEYRAKVAARLPIPGAEMKETDRLLFSRLSVYLRLRRPDARINHDFFVFRLSAAELRPVITGNLHEFTAALEQAYRQDHPTAPERKAQTP